MDKILIIPPEPWYMEAHAEYLIRYLSDEFFMEMAYIPYPPYDNFLQRFPDTSPFSRNPNDYDLLWPIWPVKWGVSQDEYHQKTAVVFYEPGEGRFKDVAVVGATTPISEASIQGRSCHSLRFGVDTEMFKPYPMVREDNLLHVGMTGNLYNTRRMTTSVVSALSHLEGVRLMLFPKTAPRNQKELDDLGGNINVIVSGNKWFTGFPNVYNRLDVYLRCEQDLGYSFPTLEAASCGVPVIATNSGIDHLITQAGGGILIDGDRGVHMGTPEVTVEKVKQAVLWMRDNPDKRKEMGMKGRQEIEKNWTWDKFIPAWREFFKEGVTNAKRKMYT